MEEQLYSFYQFPDSKNHWEGSFFLKFFVSRNVFKKGDFCQFLASKIYNKIWHCFNIFCNFCVSENFGMSPVIVAPPRCRPIMPPLRQVLSCYIFILIGTMQWNASCVDYSACRMRMLLMIYGVYMAACKELILCKVPHAIC